MLTELLLLSNDYTQLLNPNGDYLVVSSATSPQPPVTPKARLTSKARHVVARSSGTIVVALSSEKDVFPRGGTQPLISARASLTVE